jgi:DNA-binding response OmpR family regulator
MGKPRLLIVEDDFDIANMLKIFFTGHNFEVELAPRGNDALDKTRQNLPHLIILDIMLPDIDGFEVCRILRTHTRTSHVPIIFLTQKDERSDKLQGLELGADDYITKPFDIESSSCASSAPFPGQSSKA